MSIQKPSHELELDWCNPKQHGMTALMAAAQHGKLRIVALLLHAGASSAVTDVQGSTSLIYACNRGRAAIVEALVAGGAPLEHRNSFGFTALAIATAYDKAPCVRALLAAGAKPTRGVGPRVAHDSASTAVEQPLCSGHIRR